jgi:hypothetical protein
MRVISACPFYEWVGACLTHVNICSSNWAYKVLTSKFFKLYRHIYFENSICNVIVSSTFIYRMSSLTRF